MRVAIAGGHGKIGSRLARLLHERGDEPAPLIRDPAQAEELRQFGEPVVVDLEAAGESEVARAIEGADAVVFTAGAGPGSGSERKWTMDYGGAVKLIAAAKAGGISRYVIVSSQGADPGAEGEGTFAVYLRAKGKADEELRQSGLDYTVVRPTGLTDDPGAGTVEVADQVERGQVSRDDVAGVLVAVLDEPATIGKSFAVGPGNVPIEQAVAQLRR
jgi:nucleoside-diphosphate-sugar epimerase